MVEFNLLYTRGCSKGESSSFEIYYTLIPSLEPKRQLEKFIYYKTSFLSFSPEDQIRLSYIHNVLLKLNEFTLFISEKRPQINLVLLIYYELHDLLHNAAECRDEFTDLAEDIAGAVERSIKKYMKYYTFMDATDIYYTTLVLDPQVKGALLVNKLGEENAGRNILQNLRDKLHRRYPGTAEPLGMIELLEPRYKKQKVGSRILQRLQP